MLKQDFADWKKLRETKELFKTLLERRVELLEGIVQQDLPETEVYRIKGIISCIDAIISGEVIEEEDVE